MFLLKRKMFMIFGLGFFLLKWIILFLLLIYTLETMVPDLSKKKVHKEDGGYTDVSDRLVNVKENNGQPVIDFIIDIQQVHISYTRPIYSKYIATRMYTSTRLAV